MPRTPRHLRSVSFFLEERLEGGRAGRCLSNIRPKGCARSSPCCHRGAHTGLPRETTSRQMPCSPHLESRTHQRLLLQSGHTKQAMLASASPASHAALAFGEVAADVQGHGRMGGPRSSREPRPQHRSAGQQQLNGNAEPPGASQVPSIEVCRPVQKSKRYGL